MTYSSTYFLVSLSDMKEYLGISTTDTAKDAILGNIMECVTYWMETNTKRKLKARDLTEYYDGNGRDKLVLNQWPIVSTASTISVYDDTGYSFAAASLIASTDLCIYDEDGIVGLYYTTFSVGMRNVKVIYNAGYGGGTPAATVPQDLIAATREMTGYLWQRMNKRSWEVTAVTLPNAGGIQILDASAPRFVRDTIDHYKRRWVA